jgi:hypothetical protein
MIRGGFGELGKTTRVGCVYMPEIPDEFYEDAKDGEFGSADFFDWLNNEADEDTQEFISEAMDHNLSAEWAVMIGYHDGSPDPHDWDNVSINRDSEGDWAVVIVDNDGNTFSVGFDNDDLADDLIWSDLYWHLQSEGIEFDKDIDSGESA